MHATIHHPKDFFKLQEVVALRRSQWIRIEERNDHFTKIRPPMHVVDEQIILVIVVSAVSIDASASEEILEQLEYGKTPCSLHHRKPWLHLPSATHTLVALDRTAEATFSVDEADDPLLYPWSFLLIVRTDRILTDHVITLEMGCDMNEYRRILGVPSI